MTTWSDEHGIRLDARLRYRAELIDWHVLEELPTISQGQADDCVIDTGTQRVWLSRMSEADGEHCDHHITVEALIDGRWVEESAQ